jgi:hypothetical protein
MTDHKPPTDEELESWRGANPLMDYALNEIKRLRAENEVLKVSLRDEQWGRAEDHANAEVENKYGY